MSTTTKNTTSSNVKDEKSFDNEKRIVIFQNNQRERNNDPLLRGNFVLDGKVYNVKLWTKEKDGQNYLQGTIKAADDNANATTDLTFCGM